MSTEESQVESENIEKGEKTKDVKECRICKNELPPEDSEDEMEFHTLIGRNVQNVTHGFMIPAQT